MSSQNREIARFIVPWTGGIVAAQFNGFTLWGFAAGAVVAAVCAYLHSKLEA